MNGDKKNILFIGCGFMKYDNYIVAELKKQYNVYYADTAYFRHRYPNLCAFVSHTSVGKKYVRHIEEKVVEGVVRSTDEITIDKLFLIYGPGAAVTSEHLNRFKFKHPMSKFVLYLWDDWARIDQKDMLKNYFSTVYSFDTEDCGKYGFIHRPLFYIPEGEYYRKIKEIDVYCVATEQPRRVLIAKRFKDLCKRNALTYKISIVCGLRPYYLRKYFKHGSNGNDIDLFVPKIVPYEEYLENLKKSRVIIDSPHISQCGLTMRTIEALSKGVKVITTNKYIAKHTDISPKMYLVLEDATTDNEILQFIASEAFELLSTRYTLNSFLDEILYKEN